MAAENISSNLEFARLQLKRIASTPSEVMEEAQNHEVACALSGVSGELRNCLNNVSSFELRAAMAKSEDARRDNEGQQLYWARQAFIVAASANGLLGRLN